MNFQQPYHCSTQEHKITVFWGFHCFLLPNSFYRCCGFLLLRKERWPHSVPTTLVFVHSRLFLLLHVGWSAWPSMVGRTWIWLGTERFHFSLTAHVTISYQNWLLKVMWYSRISRRWKTTRARWSTAVAEDGFVHEMFQLFQMSPADSDDDKRDHILVGNP